jgi:hypothetical protein
MCSEDRGEAERDDFHVADAGAPGASAPSPDAFRRNLAGEMPLTRKSWLVARNSALKIVRLKNCCGHPGEPGC